MSGNITDVLRDKVFDFNTCDDNFIFVSYSHLDRDIIYPYVLSWINEGYNVYMDLDFWDRSSNHNWIELMKNALFSKSCKSMVCFKSNNYMYSYTSLLEILTARSQYITFNHGGPIAIDIVQLSGSNKISKELVDKFYKNREYNKTFVANNLIERNMLLAGLKDWLSIYHNKLQEFGYTNLTAEMLIDIIEKNYQQTAEDYYNIVYKLINDYLNMSGLNGNDYIIGTYDKESYLNLDKRFEHVGLAKKVAVKREKANPVKHSELKANTNRQVFSPSVSTTSKSSGLQRMDLGFKRTPKVEESNSVKLSNVLSSLGMSGNLMNLFNEEVIDKSAKKEISLDKIDLEFNKIFSKYLKYSYDRLNSGFNLLVTEEFYLPVNGFQLSQEDVDIIKNLCCAILLHFKSNSDDNDYIEYLYKLIFMTLFISRYLKDKDEALLYEELLKSLLDKSIRKGDIRSKFWQIQLVLNNSKNLISIKSLLEDCIKGNIPDAIYCYAMLFFGVYSEFCEELFKPQLDKGYKLLLKALEFDRSKWLFPLGYIHCLIEIAKCYNQGRGVRTNNNKFKEYIGIASGLIAKGIA